MAWLKRACIAAALLVVASCGFLLMVDNATPVALRLLHRETSPLPIYWWLYAAFAFGLLVGFALGYLRRRRTERRLHRTLRQRERELTEMRSEPSGPDRATQM